MDEQQIETLVEAHYQDIYAYCFRHVGDRELAQDLTQTTFLRFWRHLDRYSDRSRLKNYLYTIAGNLCKDELKRKRPALLEDLPPACRDVPAPAPDTDAALAVRAALAALPFAQRNAAILYYCHGFTAGEIAAITHTPTATVRYRLRRAAARLQELLKEVAP